MKTRNVLLLISLFVSCLCAQGQTTSEGYIIGVEKNAVYIDLNERQVAPGDRFEVYEEGGYMTHPVTGKRIRKNDKLVGTIEVGETFEEYSVARPHNLALIKQMRKGMRIIKQADGMANAGIPDPDTDRAPIVIAPAVVNDVVDNGHFGGYVADILMEQMLLCDKVRLLDRSVLGAQIDEINLSDDLMDPKTTIQRGQVIGARYALQTTMQKPDVANVRTGVPLAAFMGAVQMATGTNIGAAYASNMRVATLRAAVTISVRVVDLQTSEVVFMSSSEGEAKGKSQVALEYGALGGGELNGGVEDFKHTVTGKAIQQAFRRIGRDLNAFFSGKTDKKVMGSLSGGYSPDDKMYTKRMKLYLGTEELDKEGISMAFSETPDLFFKYKKARRKGIWGILLPVIGGAIGVGIACTEVAVETNFVCLGTGIVIGAASIGGGIVLYRNGKKEMKNVASQYNLLNSSTSYNQPRKRTGEVSFSISPTGFALTF